MSWENYKANNGSDVVMVSTDIYESVFILEIFLKLVDTREF